MPANGCYHSVRTQISVPEVENSSSAERARLGASRGPGGPGGPGGTKSSISKARGTRSAPIDGHDLDGQKTEGVEASAAITSWARGWPHGRRGQAEEAVATSADTAIAGEPVVEAYRPGEAAAVLCQLGDG